MNGSRTRRLAVVKIGGSVLPDSRAYASIARFLVRRLRACSGERFVAVVSAQDGVTNSLEQVAREIQQAPRQRTLDLLWSTGEIRSVALLALHLEALEVAAVGLNTHETGILKLTASATPSIHFDGNLLGRALDKASIVVVPGFFATTSDAAITSLGRGGSDLTAVLLAAALDAKRCELVKDVPGYFSSDPRENKKARHFPVLSYQRAIAMARNGCPVVQKEALEAGERADLALVVRSIASDGTCTVVSRTEALASTG
jgi:aspartate kinase